MIEWIILFIAYAPRNTVFMVFRGAKTMHNLAGKRCWTDKIDSAIDEGPVNVTWNTKEKETQRWDKTTRTNWVICNTLFIEMPSKRTKQTRKSKKKNLEIQWTINGDVWTRAQKRAECDTRIKMIKIPNNDRCGYEETEFLNTRLEKILQQLKNYTIKLKKKRGDADNWMRGMRETNERD